MGWAGRTICGAGLIGPKPGYTYIGGTGGGWTGIPTGMGLIIIGGLGPLPSMCIGCTGGAPCGALLANCGGAPCGALLTNCGGSGPEGLVGGGGLTGTGGLI